MPHVLVGSKYDLRNGRESGNHDTGEATAGLGIAGSSETGEFSLHPGLVYS